MTTQHLLRSVSSTLSAIALLGMLLAPCALPAQTGNKILSVTAPEGKEGDPLTIKAELAPSAGITQVLLAYRPAGTAEYTRVEMPLAGTAAAVTIPGNEVRAPQLEYYFILHGDGTAEETHPAVNPDGAPLRTQVQGTDERDKMIIFLSPDAGSSNTLEELFISISLIKASPRVNKSATKIYIDERDVTDVAVMSDELITLMPENITPPLAEGSHLIKVELYDTEGTFFHSTSLSFVQVSLETAARQQTLLRYNVSAQLEARNETVQDNATSYNRGTLAASSDYGAIHLNGRLFVTNEEKESRQPQNRYHIQANTSWLSVGYGDAYPTFPSLIMGGKRLRGLTSNLKLGFFNVDFAQGEISRKIEGNMLHAVPAESLSYYQQVGRNPADSSQWVAFSSGTFKRDLLALRPSFGKGENFQLGFSYLKSKDDATSILYGVKPQENLAVGSDLVIAFDNHHFELTGQAAASIYNADIASGSLTDAQIDQQFRSDDDSLKKRDDLRTLRDMVSNFITVNQNLVPLAVDKLTSILSYEGGLALDYFNNYLKGSYIFHGGNYRSFGQSFIRNDVKGFNVFDRIRLLDNQFFLSVGVERLEDNTDDTKISTTTFTNLNSTVSYFPRFRFPNITVGFGRNTTLNTIARAASGAVDDKSNRIFLQSNYDLTAGGLRHNVSLNLSTFQRDDLTPRDADSKSTNVSTLVTTSWSAPLQTTAGVTFNMNTLPRPDPLNSAATIAADFNYTSLVVGARYRMMDNRLRFSGLISPTFGDFTRTMWDLGAEYDLIEAVTAASQLSILQNADISTDVVWSLVLRYNM